MTTNKQFGNSLFIAILLISIISCRNTDVKNLRKLIHDSAALTEKEIPKEILSKEVEERKKWFDSTIGFEDLTSVGKGFQLRISEENRNDSGSVFNLKKSNGVIKATLVNYHVSDMTMKLGSLRSVRFQSIPLVNPKSGLKEFEKKLNKFDFDSFFVKERNVTEFDSEWMVTTVELTNSGKYAVANYTDIDKKNNRELENLRMFIRFFRAEFGIH